MAQMSFVSLVSSGVRTKRLKAHEFRQDLGSYCYALCKLVSELRSLIGVRILGWDYKASFLNSYALNLSLSSDSDMTGL